MTRLLLLLAAVFFWVAPASAQNPTCPTRQVGDSTNACASTAFVQQNKGTNLPLANGQIYVGNGSNVAVATPPTTFLDNTFCNTVGYIIVRLTGSWQCAQGIPVNVRWFGAVGDGSTDDTTAIRNAITAAAGNPVFLPEGDYSVTCVGAGCDIFSSTDQIQVYGIGNGQGPGPASQTATNASRFRIQCSTCNLFKVTSIYPSIFRDFAVNVEPGARPHSGIGVYLIGTGTSRVSNYKVLNLAFLNVGTGVRVVRPQWGVISGSYFDSWTTAGIYFETSLAVEGSGGFVSQNYFFGTTTTPGFAFYSEVGYTILDGNEILGGLDSVRFNIKNIAAGFIKVTNNTIENFGQVGIHISRGDVLGTTVAAMVMLQGNEFSEVSAVATASIQIDEDTTLPAWIKDGLITGNISRNVMKAGAKHFWIQAGQNMQVTGNIIEELGANNPTGIYVNGATINTGLVAPFNVFDNIVTGTTSQYVFAANPAAQLRDVNGMTLANVPANIGNGSQVFITNADPASGPCTAVGAQTGAMAFKQNGALKCF